MLFLILFSGLLANNAFAEIDGPTNIELFSTPVIIAQPLKEELDAIFGGACFSQGSDTHHNVGFALYRCTAKIKNTVRPRDALFFLYDKHQQQVLYQAGRVGFMYIQSGWYVLSELCSGHSARCRIFLRDGYPALEFE